MIRWITLALGSALLISGCDDKSSAPDGEGAAAVQNLPEEVDEQIKKGVKDELAGKGPKWRVEYAGDLSGEVEGGIMSVVNVAGNLTVGGGAMTEDRRRKAPQAFSATIREMPEQGLTTLMTRLKLADGTVCNHVPEQNAKVEVMNSEKGELEAKITGTLTCGEDGKTITYTALLDQTP